MCMVASIFLTLPPLSAHTGNAADSRVIHSAELGRIGCILGVLATSTFVMSDGFKIIFGSFQIMKQFSY